MCNWENNIFSNLCSIPAAFNLFLDNFPIPWLYFLFRLFPDTFPISWSRFQPLGYFPCSIPVFNLFPDNFPIPWLYLLFSLFHYTFPIPCKKEKNIHYCYCTPMILPHVNSQLALTRYFPTSLSVSLFQPLPRYVLSQFPDCFLC